MIKFNIIGQASDTRQWLLNFHFDYSGDSSQH